MRTAHHNFSYTIQDILWFSTRNVKGSISFCSSVTRAFYPQKAWQWPDYPYLWVKWRIHKWILLIYKHVSQYFFGIINIGLDICIKSNITWLSETSIFSCDQAALRTLISVCFCLSVRPSVRPSQCSCHCIILKFSGVITIDRRDVHAKGEGQRSKVNITEIMTPFSRFRAVASVWIHIWRWNNAPSLMLFRRGALLFFKVIRQISRSHS